MDGTIGPSSYWFTGRSSVIDYVAYGDVHPAIEHLKECWVCGNSALDGMSVMALDLNPGRSGEIIFCTYGMVMYGGDIPIVAKSFEEWLERTVAAGPNAQAPYWELPGFVDIGPAIPGDPQYRVREPSNMRRPWDIGGRVVLRPAQEK